MKVKEYIDNKLSEDKILQEELLWTESLIKAQKRISLTNPSDNNFMCLVEQYNKIKDDYQKWLEKEIEDVQE